MQELTRIDRVTGEIIGADELRRCTSCKGKKPIGEFKVKKNGELTKTCRRCLEIKDGQEKGIIPITGRIYPPKEERFWASVDKTGDCWIWTGQLHEHGYGLFSYKHDWHRAHRVSYEMEYGAIPEGMNVLHRCDHPACVRPDHLFLGTQLDNIRDMYAKGRQWTGIRRRVVGEQTSSAIMTEEEVRAIRRLRAEGMRTSDIARQLGRNYYTVYNVVSGETWGWMEDAS